MTRYAYLNGEVAPLDETSVSVQDRGFLFGDAVYDVVRLMNGSLFRLDRHIERLRANAATLEFEARPDPETIRRAARRVVERSDLDEGMLYMQCTRGVEPRRAAPSEDLEPTLLVYVDAVHRPIDAIREQGGRAKLVPEIRWQRCDAKTVNLLPKVLMKRDAKRSGCYEAIFTSENGEVWEGSSTNVFVVEDGRLRTPEDAERILPGITRREILEIAAEEGMSVELSSVFVSDLYDADEVFLTGTLTEVLGLVEIDRRTIGDGEVGPVARRLHARLLERRERETSS